MIKVVSDFISLFENEGMRYCHWKSSQHLNATANGDTDLDILIHVNDFDKARNLLPSIGFKEFEIDSHRKYPFIHDFLAYDIDSDKIVHLHVHTRINIGPKHHKYILFPFENEILESRVKDKVYNIYRISYEIELLLLLIRQSAKIRKRDYLLRPFGFNLISRNYIREYEWLCEQIPINLVYEKEKMLFGMSLLKKDNICIKNDAYRLIKIRKIAKLFKKEGRLIYLQGRIKSMLTRWYRELYRVVYEITKKAGLIYIPNRRNSYKSGIVFAFVGGDGSGKSSVSKEVYYKLLKQMNCVHLYLGTGKGRNSWLLTCFKPFHNLLHKIGVLSVEGKVAMLKNENINMKSHESKFRDIFRLPWAFVLLYDRYYKLNKLKKHLMRGYIVITDRYPQNEICNIFDGPRLTNIFSNLEQNIIKQYEGISPYIFRFECSPEVCVQRKSDEVTYDQAKLNLELLQSIEFYKSDKSFYINADLKFMKVIRECMSIIFNKL